jgi:hypothetical protein
MTLDFSQVLASDPSAPRSLTVEELPFLFEAINAFEESLDKKLIAYSQEVQRLQDSMKGKTYEEIQDIYAELNKLEHPGYMSVFCSGWVESPHPCLDQVKFPSCKKYWSEHYPSTPNGPAEYSDGCCMDNEVTNEFWNPKWKFKEYFFDNFFECHRAHECPFYAPDV